MKLIIDIPNDVYEHIKSTETIETVDYDIVSLYRAIKNSTSVSTDGDLISRSELKKAFALLMWKEHNPYDTVKVCDIVNQTLDFIDNTPIVEERPQGKWIDTGEKMENYSKWYRCSNCENTNYYGNFCPNCGADMRGNKK